MLMQLFASNGWYLLFFVLCIIGGYNLIRIKNVRNRKKRRKEELQNEIDFNKLVAMIQKDKEVPEDEMEN